MTPAEKYHMRRSEKAIKGHDKMLGLLMRQKYVTLALSRNDEPCLVTVNHGFDKASMCLYFHCSQKGKKVDYIKANPTVWGQVLEDLGYADGKCDHAFKAAQFRGVAEFVTDDAEKRHALELMIDRLESEPTKVKKRLLTEAKMDNVAICRIKIEELSGKENLP